jgi:hypothetical protein
MVVIGKFRNGAELRKKPRRQFHYNAGILIDQTSAPIPCMISDISESGARLSLEGAAELPESFVLLLIPNGAARRSCRIIWREGTTVGVVFPQAG